MYFNRIRFKKRISTTLNMIHIKFQILLCLIFQLKLKKQYRKTHSFSFGAYWIDMMVKYLHYGLNNNWE